MFLPFKASFDEVMDCILVNVLLAGLGIVDVVEGESFVRAQPSLWLSWSLGDTYFARIYDLFGKLGMTGSRFDQLNNVLTWQSHTEFDTGRTKGKNN